MSIGKGINLSTGFDLNAQQPLDNRDVFETIRERDALPQINTYEGMKCYVKETKSNYQYIDGAWVSADVDNNSIAYGITPPTSEDTLIWVDTSGNLSGINYEDAFVEEVRESMFQATESLIDDIEGVKTRIENLENVDITHNKEIEKNKSDISSINSEVSSIKTNISNIGGEVSIIKPSVNNLVTEVTTINGKISTTNKRIDDGDSKITAVENRCSKIEKESVPNLTGQISLVRTDLQTLSDLNATYGEKIEEIEGNVDSIDSEIQPIKVNISEINTVLERDIGEIREVQAKSQLYKLTEDNGQIKYITTNNLSVYNLEAGNYACVANRFTDLPIPNNTGYVEINVRIDSNDSGNKVRKIITVWYVYSERIFIGQKHHNYDYMEWKEINFNSGNGCYTQLFYATEVEDLYKKLIKIQDENTKSIGFITDTHYTKENRGHYGMEALRHIDQIVDFGNGVLDCIIHGGDVINGKGENELITELMDVNKHLLKANVPTFLCRGNHDVGGWKIDNQTDKKYDENMITHNTWSRLVTNKYINKYGFIGDKNNKSACYSYYDFEDVKLRIINLDVMDNQKEHITDADGNVTVDCTTFCVGQKQADWIVNQALQLPEKSGWTVIAFAHSPFYKPYDIDSSSSIRNGGIIHNIFKAFNTGSSYTYSNKDEVYRITTSCDFTDTSNKFVGFVTGHHHRDVRAKRDFEYITLNSSASRCNDQDGNEMYREMGTIEEDSWTVLTVNVATRKLYINRFGANKSFEQIIDF